jgi:hypothetical protein
VAHSGINSRFKAHKKGIREKIISKASCFTLENNFLPNFLSSLFCTRNQNLSFSEEGRRKNKIPQSEREDLKQHSKTEFLRTEKRLR